MDFPSLEFMGTMAHICAPKAQWWSLGFKVQDRDQDRDLTIQDQGRDQDHPSKTETWLSEINTETSHLTKAQ